jgi:hypothetical protein
MYNDLSEEEKTRLFEDLKVCFTKEDETDVLFTPLKI